MYRVWLDGPVSVHQRGDKWVTRVYLGRDPKTGKPKRTFATFRTRREAKQAEADVRMRLHKGTFVPASQKTVAVYLREWLAAARIDLRPASLPGYQISVDKHLIPRLGALRLQQLKPHHLTATYAELLEHGRCDGRGGLSVRTVRLTHTIMRKALADAVSSRELEWNPAVAAKPPKARTADEAARKTRQYWNSGQLRTFLDSLRDHQFGAAFHLAATTGMRRGELLGLRWRDVDLDSGRLVVEQTLVMPKTLIDGVWKYQLVFSEPKTKTSRRSIDLDHETVTVLRHHRTRQLKDRLLLGGLQADTDLVFRTLEGGPIMPETFSQAFKRAAKAAGLTPIRLHDLRHTHVALLAQAGVPAKVIQERVGHHSAGFTLDHYGGTFPSQHRDAAERVAALINHNPKGAST
jgi:integrase